MKTWQYHADYKIHGYIYIIKKVGQTNTTQPYSELHASTILRSCESRRGCGTAYIGLGEWIQESVSEEETTV